MASVPRRADVAELELLGGVEQREIRLEDYDPSRPRHFREHGCRIRGALESAAILVEHIGSTSVPGLAAKPIIDVLVAVPDITDEEAYVEPLVRAGYELRVREPGHRMLRTPERSVHVHVWQHGDPEIDEYLIFRDRLRNDEDDRKLYEDTKRALAAREWPDMNAYADAKGPVIAAIKARARAELTQ